MGQSGISHGSSRRSARGCRFPDIEYAELIVDNACMQLVRDPTQYDMLIMCALLSPSHTRLPARSAACSCAPMHVCTSPERLCAHMTVWAQMGVLSYRLLIRLMFAADGASQGLWMVIALARAVCRQPGMTCAEQLA